MLKSQSEIFAKEIHENIISDGLKEYTKIYEQIDYEKSSQDPYLNALKTIWPDLTEVKKKAFLLILKQVMIDTTASVFAKFDGSSFLNSFEGDFKITHDDIVLEYLTDHFLAYNEEQSDP